MRNVDYLIDSCKFLVKYQIAEFVGVSLAKKKDDLLLILKEKLQADPGKIIEIYKEYRDSLAAAPYEVESILNCTPTERKKWTALARLPVLPWTKNVKVPGNWIDCPVYDRYALAQISPDDLENWRGEDNAVKRANRIAGSLKAKKTKQKNDMVRDVFKNEWQRNVKTWDEIGPVLSAVFQLAYWTMWISRWAKVYKLKQKRYRSITLTSLYRSEKFKYLSADFYYDKEKALELLMKSPFALTSVYIPEDPHKHFINICSKHFGKYEMYEMDRDEKIEFYLSFEELKSCPECCYKMTEHYYSLVHVAISDPRVDFKFSFHIPYPNISYLLPCSIDLMPQVQHVEQEGMFRFGRPVYDDEKIIYTEKFVKRNFDNALSHLENLSHK